MIVSNLVLTIIAIIVIFLIIYLTIQRNKHTGIVGSCGLIYYVVNDGNMAKCRYAANLLCEINNRCMKLITHLSNNINKFDEFKQQMIKKLIEEYDVDDLIENENEAFTINKGQKIHICLKSNGQFLPLNTIMFVVIHELAHVICSHYSHSSEYWLGNIWLMKISVEIGILRPVDYSQSPVSYCNGLVIDRNPMFDNGFIQQMKELHRMGNKENIVG